MQVWSQLEPFQSTEEDPDVTPLVLLPQTGSGQLLVRVHSSNCYIKHQR